MRQGWPLLRTVPCTVLCAMGHNILQIATRGWHPATRVQLYRVTAKARHIVDLPLPAGPTGSKSDGGSLVASKCTRQLK